MPVRTVLKTEMLASGVVYVAAGDRNIEFISPIAVTATEPSHNSDLSPSADALLKSAARYLGSRCVPILLSGMGRDGAEGLVALKKAGAKTIVQDEQSSAVWGMPGAAIERGGAALVIGPEAIARMLRRLEFREA
jgi:two-component system chemotaxis response regulator CheB